MTNLLLIILYAIQEAWPPASKFLAADVPDLSGKVFLVTGGNAGIGKETARVLLEHNAKVYIGCRSPEKANAAADELKSKTGKTDADLVVLRLDLGDLGSVKAAVDEFLSKESRLDVLINNAGVMTPPLSQLTAHGHDLQFGTNVLGHFYLTQLLLPTLLSTAKLNEGAVEGGGEGDGKARVVNVSSNGHWGTSAGKDGVIRYGTLSDGEERNMMMTEQLYCQSKSGNILFSHALARKYGEQGIVSTSLNPGIIQSELVRHTGAVLKRILSWVQFPVDLGALTQLYAATSPEGAGLNGKYLGPWARIRPSEKKLDVVDEQERMWSWCEEQVKLYAPA